MAVTSSNSISPIVRPEAPRDLSAEIREVEVQLAEKKELLTSLQTSLREFREQYAAIVGSRLAELTELEKAVSKAQEASLGIEPEAEKPPTDPGAEADSPVQPRGASVSLKTLFRSVAKLFHPDHASDSAEAKRRHTVMAKANRAYEEGDFESLEMLLGDNELKFFCTPTAESDKSLAEVLWDLKDELRTIEFGIKRIERDPIYRIKLEAEELSLFGRDLLEEKAASLTRKINKLAKKLQHFS